MKKTISITVDMDTWIIAKEKVNNLSKYLNECLYGLTGRNEIYQDKVKLEEEIQYTKKAIQELFIKQSLAQEALRLMEEAQIVKAKELEANEQYKRWVCPVCKTLNFMDNYECSKCRLKTRNDSKLTITSTKEITQ
jgi:rubrerythrin